MLSTQQKSRNHWLSAKLFDVGSLSFQRNGDALSKYHQLPIVRGKEQCQCYRPGYVAWHRNHVWERLLADFEFAVEDVAREFANVSYDRSFLYGNGDVLNQSDSVVYTRLADALMNVSGPKSDFHGAIQVRNLRQHGVMEFDRCI